MRSQRAPSLRTTLVTLTMVVTALVLLVSCALVVLTTLLQHTTAQIGASVENVRLAEEAELDLLLHDRAGDVIVRRNIEGNLRRKLRDARADGTDAEEARLLDEADTHVERYLSAAWDSERSREEVLLHEHIAFGALDALASLNVEQANQAQARAAQWNELARVLGIGVALLMLSVAAMLLFWLKSRAFEPLLALSAAMERFGKGERDVRAHERGASELREMSRRFNEMASALAAQRRAQMAFLGGVAHDLRNPLSVLRTAVSMSVENTHGQRTLEIAERQITRLERMIGDFLDITKIEAGELELKLSRQDARALAIEVADLFEGAAPGHEIVLSLPDRPILVHCDPLRIEQVLTNIVSNAIKYSPAGGSVTISLAERGREVLFVVTDQGFGIAEEDRAHLFEPFRRVGLSKETVPGVGLGLFIVARIVEAHGGHIDVESTPGRGSTFCVRIPSELDPAPESERRAPDTFLS